MVITLSWVLSFLSLIKTLSFPSLRRHWPRCFPRIRSSPVSLFFVPSFTDASVFLCIGSLKRPPFSAQCCSSPKCSRTISLCFFPQRPLFSFYPRVVRTCRFFPQSGLPPMPLARSSYGLLMVSRLAPRFSSFLFSIFADVPPPCNFGSSQ